jgi:L-rhamnose mutarotase
MPQLVALHSVLRAGCEEAYDAAHARIPDDLIAAHRRVGIHDWQIWRSGRHLFHLVECDDFAAAIDGLRDDPANERWQRTIGGYVDRFESTPAGDWQLPLVWRMRDQLASYAVDFQTVSTVGLESSPVAAALAGLRAHEARYFNKKYDHVFTVEPASNAKTTIDWVHRILREERDIVISARPLEATAFQVENIRIAYVFYESGLSINVMYGVDDPSKRAVGFKLSEGMDVPEELASRFKFASQKSKLAGTIRGSYFAFKSDY